MMIRNILVICLLVLGVCQPLSALQIHYDEDRDVVLRECDNKAYQGNRNAAKNCYTGLLNHVDPLVQAEAYWALGDGREANRQFRAAAKADENSAAVKTRWAQLYVSTHQMSDAFELFNEALQIDADYLPAKLAMARATFKRFEGKVRVQLEEILSEHPDSLEAHVLMANLVLELKETKIARQHLNKAAILAKKTDMPLLELFALQAAADLLDGEIQSDAIQKSLDANPHYGGIYAIPAHFYIITYRYREAVELYRRAVEIEPDLWSAHAALGINLLRINQVEEARHHLEIAYDGDPYATATVNTLRLLDTLEGMELVPVEVEYAVPNQNSQGISKTHRVTIILRLDQSEAQVLKPYLQKIVSDAVETLSRRYDFHLERPLIVELYPNHDDFAVRTVSTPGVGLLGVTFGYLLAMDSPRAKPEGYFHWASVLWHELVHVFTLEASNHRIPRWFGEGLSVYEEWRTGPLPGRQLPVSVFDAMKAGKFLPVTTLDQGFIRPTYRGQISVSYMQAGLICDFIAERWGHDALIQMLRHFATGKGTESAVRTVLKLDPAMFDVLFHQAINARYSAVVDNIEHWRKHLSAAETYVAEANWSQVREPAEAALKILPEYVGPGNAYISLAKMYKATGDSEQSLEMYRLWLQKGGHQPDLLRALAKEFSAQGKTDDAINVLATLNLVAPYSLDSHSRLAELYLSNQQAKLALQEYEVMLGLEPLDTAPVFLGKAKAFRLLGDHGESRRQILYSLEQAPFYREAQHLLIELVKNTP